jgi:hypothetical protein
MRPAGSRLFRNIVVTPYAALLLARIKAEHKQQTAPSRTLEITRMILARQIQADAENDAAR